MKKLKMFVPQDFTSAWNDTPPLELDSKCARCELSAGARTKCMRPEGEPGGLLLVGEFPSRAEDEVGRPMIGHTGKYLRDLVAKWWPGSVAITSALLCAPGKTKLSDKHIRQCRPYGAKVARDAAPQRIVALGNSAMKSITGRGGGISNMRRGYGWHVDEEGVFVPVFYVHNPVAALRNKFVQKQFESDLKWALTCAQPVPKFRGSTYLVRTARDAKIAGADLMTTGEITYDVETHGKMGNPDFRIECATLLGEKAKHAYTWTREAMRDPGARAALKRLLDDGPPLSGQNVKYDNLSTMHDLGAKMGDPRRVAVDIRLWRKLLDAESSANLAVMSEQVGLGGYWKKSDDSVDDVRGDIMYHSAPPVGLTPTGRQRKVRPQKYPVPKAVLDQVRDGAHPMAFVYGYVPDELLYRYNACDTYVTRMIKRRLEKQVSSDAELWRVWELISRPASMAAQWMEFWGIKADRAHVEQFRDYCNVRTEMALAQMQKYGDFNPKSPTQLRDFLFKKLGLPYVRLTESGLESTDRDTLEELKDKHPVIEPLLSFRRYDKLGSTYAAGMLKHIRADGRIHASFLLDGAGTGRLSARDPNLQNLPRPKGRTPAETEEAKMARDSFIVEDGWVLVEADYAQQELRVAALLSGDAVMIADFKSGLDMHRNGARECCEVAWKIPRSKWDAMSKDEQDPYRSQIKAIIFGKLYGKTDASIAAEFGVSVRTVQAINSKIWGRYKTLDRWCREQVKLARKLGYVRTWWAGQPARRRPLIAIGEGDEDRRRNAENAAVNCLDAETEALTNRGWVRGFDLRPDDKLLTKNPQSGELEWQRMTDLRLWPDYEGPMIEFKSRSFHAVTTPEHRWLVRDKSSGRDVERTSKTISPWGDHRIHRTGDYKAAHSLITSDEAELLGWFVTDGSIKRTSRLASGVGKRGPRMRAEGVRAQLFQSTRANLWKCDRIDALLARLDKPFKKALTKGGTYAVWSLGPELTSLLIDLAPDRTLRVDTLPCLGRAELERLRESMMLGDGTGLGTKEVFTTGRREQAEAFQVLCTLTGACASIKWRDMSMYEPRSLKLMNKAPPKMTGVWTVTVLRRDTAQVTHDQVTTRVSRQPVWCPVVPNTFFVARRSGHVFITGNTPVQGTAADFMTASLWPLCAWILETKVPARMVATVHDSLLVEVRKDKAEEVARKMREVLLSHDSAGVPLKVDFKMGDRYGSMKEFEL
jgi:uracil-DNA glycosylase family 4